ncbi:MAG: NifU family protein [Actinomycetota bacterium]|nr:NifU family protein [Actinomycetota bacterium]
MTRRVPEPQVPPVEPADELDPLLDRLEELLAGLESFEEPVREHVLELLDGVDALHRLALQRLAAAASDALPGLRRADPAIDWLFQAYGVGVDDVAAAVRALDPMQPYLRQHGGDVEVMAVSDGVVRVRLSGACRGCTGSAVTLREGVETALRNGLPGFVALDVEPDDQARPHAPPGPTLLQIQPRPV